MTSKIKIPFLSLISLGMLLQISTPGIAAMPAANLAAPEAVACEKDMSFGAWLEGVKQQARAEGITAATLNLALPYLKRDSSVLERDRAQGVFQQPFLQFSDRMISGARLKKGASLIKTNYKDLLIQIEKDFGVPPEPIVAFWALESDFGAFTGKFPILSAITTLAYDCRRPGMFRPQLIDALKVIQRGDLMPAEMIGNWAGELGGTQFMASDYFDSGVDYDKDGRVNLVKSIPDTLASAAQFLVHHGWVRHQPWLQEVKLPSVMRWEEADLTIQHPVSQWSAWGVTPTQGSLADQNMQASLLLPMGRLGPAFLAYPNFQAFLGWNSSLVYSTTAAVLATRLAGAGPLYRGNGIVKSLDQDQMLQLQKLLAAMGLDPGPLDGKLGSATRTAAKQAQLKLGLPADSYPSLELLQKLKH